MLFRRRFVFVAAGAVFVLGVAVWAANRAAAAAQTTPAAAPFDLSRYQNRNRLVFVFAPSARDKRFAAQVALWKNKEAGFADRELIPFFVLERGKNKRGSQDLSPGETADLRRRFGIKPGQFRVLLVGKDGHTAFSSPRAVSLPDLFARIDAMPMRRDEMRRRASGKK